MKLIEDYCAEQRPPDAARLHLIRQRVSDGIAATQSSGPPLRRRVGPRSFIRRGLAVAGIATLAAIAAAVVPAMLPGSAAKSFVTSAWAVRKSPDGTITVELYKTLRDQRALQHALRAEGVRAYVRSMDGCKYWTPTGGIKQIKQDWKALLFPAPGNTDHNFREIIIHPAALPKGHAIFIGGSTLPHGGLAEQLFIMPGGHPPVCVPGTGPQPARTAHSAG